MNAWSQPFNSTIPNLKVTDGLGQAFDSAILFRFEASCLMVLRLPVLESQNQRPDPFTSENRRIKGLTPHDGIA
jgi:hypothetical protein